MKNHVEARTSALAALASLYIRFCFATKKIHRVLHPESRDLLLIKKPVVLGFWHCSDFAAAWFFRGQPHVFPMASLSGDGALMAEFLRRFDVGVGLRGSGHRGGLTGVRSSLRLLREGFTIAFALDGSRGPRLKAKDGALRVAGLSGCPILPMGFADSRTRVLRKTWDLNRCPLPTGQAMILIGKPLYFSRQASRGEKERLDEAVEKVDREAHRLLAVEWPG